MSKAKASANIRRWRGDAKAFVREVFKVEPDAWQLDVLDALPRNQRLAMKACKGPGKTCLLAWIAWWFLVCFLHPKIAATSISADNLADGLWSEMSKWQQRSEFLKVAFTWTKTRIFANDHPETWWMSARTWAKGSNTEQQANTLAGLHADSILFLLDESGGTPDAVMAAAEAALANDHTKTKAKIVMAGNPTHLEGPLYRATTTERHLWHLTEITADPDDPKRTPRVSIDWAREQIEKYGKDNPWVMVNVYGKFPPSSINTLLGPDEVSAAMGRHLTEDQYCFAQKRLGIDAARFGDDPWIIAPRQGLAAFTLAEMRNPRSHEVAARVALAKSRFGSEIEAFDGSGGFAAGAIDGMIQAGHNPLEISFSGKASDSRYFNKRSEMWFLMADWVKRGGALPNDPTLAKELCCPTYFFQNGKFRLEEKDQIKARLGFSPNRADALALTFCLPEMPASDSLQGMKNARTGNRSQSDWDPFDEKRSAR